jgi:hypothetical protein
MRTGPTETAMRAAQVVLGSGNSTSSSRQRCCGGVTRRHAAALSGQRQCREKRMPHAVFLMGESDDS